MPLVDEIKERLRDLQTDPGGVSQGLGPVERFQAFSAPIGEYRPPLVDVSERAISGPHGPIPVRIYRPRTTESSGIGLVWLHGGGFTSGDLDMPESDVVARELCDRAKATVVSVGYRLAGPSVHFPVPHDDVAAAWRWVAEACSEIGVDPHRLSIGGCSAGGNLAAGVAITLRDERSLQPRWLVLAYPALHAELPSTAEALPADIELLPDALRYSPESYRRVVAGYIGEGGSPNPHAFPAMADLRGMPETVVITCEYDDLRTSGEAFATALSTAGVRVVRRREPGVPHGYLNIPGLHAFDCSMRLITTALAQTCPR